MSPGRTTVFAARVLQRERQPLQQLPGYRSEPGWFAPPGGPSLTQSVRSGADDACQCGRLARQDASRERSVYIVSCVEGRSAKPVSSVTIVSAPAEMAVAAWAAS
jgi:hypothetical protein